MGQPGLLPRENRRPQGRRDGHGKRRIARSHRRGVSLHDRAGAGRAGKKERGTRSVVVVHGQGTVSGRGRLGGGPQRSARHGSVSVEAEKSEGQQNRIFELGPANTTRAVAPGASFSQFKKRGGTDTGCILATSDAEMRKTGPRPKGCGGNPAILHS